MRDISLRYPVRPYLKRLRWLESLRRVPGFATLIPPRNFISLGVEWDSRTVMHLRLALRTDRRRSLPGSRRMMSR